MNVKEIFKYLFSLFFWSFILFVIWQKMALLDHADDYDFSRALENQDILSYLKTRYISWSGRSAIEALLVLTIKYPIYWKIMAFLSWISISFSIWIMSGWNRISIWYFLPIVMASLLMLDKDVIYWAATWVTGTYNYLQPCAAALLLLFLFVSQQKKSIHLKLLSLPIAVYAVSNEQFAISFVMPLLIFFFISDKSNRTVYGYAVMVFTFSFIMLNIISPGNDVRFIVAARYYPDYIFMGFLNKITLGLDLFGSYISSSKALPFNAFSGFLVFLFFRQGSKHIASYLAFSVVLLQVMFFLGLWSGLIDSVFSYNDYLMNLGRVYSPWEFKFVLWGMLVVTALITLLLSVIECIKTCVFLVLLMICSVASVVMLGFSPTIYASGARVFFLFNVIMIFAIFSLSGYFFANSFGGIKE